MQPAVELRDRLRGGLPAIDARIEQRVQLLPEGDRFREKLVTLLAMTRLPNVEHTRVLAPFEKPSRGGEVILRPQCEAVMNGVHEVEAGTAAIQPDLPDGALSHERAHAAVLRQ